MQDHNMRAHALHDIELVGAEENDFASARQLLDQASHHQHRSDIEAREWFIQQDETRIMKQGRRQENRLVRFRSSSMKESWRARGLPYLDTACAALFPVTGFSSCL